MQNDDGLNERMERMEDRLVKMERNIKTSNRVGKLTLCLVLGQVLVLVLLALGGVLAFYLQNSSIPECVEVKTVLCTLSKKFIGTGFEARPDRNF